MDASLGRGEFPKPVFDFWEAGRAFYFWGTLSARLGEALLDFALGAEPGVLALRAGALCLIFLRGRLHYFSMALDGLGGLCICFPLEKVEGDAKAIGWGKFGDAREE